MDSGRALKRSRILRGLDPSRRPGRSLQELVRQGRERGTEAFGEIFRFWVASLASRFEQVVSFLRSVGLVSMYPRRSAGKPFR
jgi:hypothetical protein